MKERPILFSAPMVRAVLDGNKTQTRRVVKRLPWFDPAGNRWLIGDLKFNTEAVAMATLPLLSPYGRPGDQLWVRETWAQPAAMDPGPTVYRADYPACVPVGYENIPPADQITWKPSIHMPRALSRILLEVTGVRVERLNDIDGRDAIAEGLVDLGIEGARWHWDKCAKEGYFAPWRAYRALWEQINGAGSWEANPWVWVVEFKRVEADKLRQAA